MLNTFSGERVTDPNTRWSLRLLESIERELIEELKTASEPTTSQRAWEGLNMTQRAMLHLLGLERKRW